MWPPYAKTLAWLPSVWRKSQLQVFCKVHKVWFIIFDLQMGKQDTEN